jgi:Flp pilus assembly protein CpaB
MNNNRIIFALCCAGLLGIAYLGSSIYIDNRLDLIEIPVAAQDMAPRTLITKEHIAMVKMPKAYVPASIVLDPQVLIGQYTLINALIPKSSFLYGNTVETLKEAKDYPSLLLKEGQVVYALDVDLKSTSGNTLQPLQKIDLYVTIDYNRMTVVDQLIGNVRILSLKDKNGKDIEKPSELPKLMLVAIDQSLVSLLTKAIELGDLIITPSAQDNQNPESILILNTTLLKVLYER